ncbi:ubiquitin fusion degradation protein 1 [Cladochytrium replicatum]|nr:ubiquitin fusion degradation protein 1 [Cladochytrium replicatum]
MFQGYDDYDTFFPNARHGSFIEHFRCYSVAMLPGNERQDVNYGGKVILPPSALAKLSGLNIQYPMLFELTNSSRSKATHAGVLEFIAEEGKVYVPRWMMQTLLLEEGDVVRVSNTSLPLGTFVKIQPQSTDFLDITDPKAVLENAFRNFTTLTEGDIITIKYNNKMYDILVMETKPGGKGISIIETDLEVDFAPPLGYVEENYKPVKKPSSSHLSGSLPSIDEHTIERASPRFTPFKGSGSKLSGKPAEKVASSDTPSSQTSSSSGSLANQTPAALVLPPGKLFFGYPVIPLKKNQAGANGGEEKKAFVGAGQTLRTARKGVGRSGSGSSSSLSRPSSPAAGPSARKYP